MRNSTLAFLFASSSLELFSRGEEGEGEGKRAYVVNIIELEIFQTFLSFSRTSLVDCIATSADLLRT